VGHRPGRALPQDERMTLTAQFMAETRGSGQLAVDLDGVVKRFGAVTAVDGISLRIRPGEVVALLGPNGAGKTSTVDMLLGLSQPTAGTVEVYGRAPHEAVALGLVSAVMQTGGLLKDYTVEETVKLTAVLFGRPASAAGEALQRAGIADIGKRLVGKCSGGQQQRLRFAMALLPDPELLILDEPTTGMDVGGRHDSGPPSARTPAAAARSSSPPTTWRKPTRTPTGWSSCAAGRSWPTARRPRSRPWRRAAPSGPP